MRRRDFITGVAGSVAAWPLATHAQQPDRMRRIGVLMAYGEENNSEAKKWLATFREGLQKLGWTEGQRIRFDYRWATTNPKLIEKSAKELVALQPQLIVSSSTPTTATLLKETRVIPIIFANIVDPVGQGFVASLARPGGNATGFVNLEASMAGKWLELLKEIAPRVTRVAVPFNPATAPYADFYLNHFRTAAAALSVEVVSAPVRDIEALESFVAARVHEPNGGLVPLPDAFMIAHRAEIATMAARLQLPSVYFSRAFTEAGGLLSYGNDIVDNYRRAATYADRILRGEKPSELPVQFPVAFELVINLKTARALGLNVPLHLQQRADEVIE